MLPIAIPSTPKKLMRIIPNNKYPNAAMEETQTRKFTFPTPINNRAIKGWKLCINNVIER